MKPAFQVFKWHVRIYSRGKHVFTATTTAQTRDMARCLAWNALRESTKGLMPGGLTFKVSMDRETCPQAKQACAPSSYAVK